MRHLIALTVALLISASAMPCTICVVARNGQVIAAGNEDNANIDAKSRHWVRFAPAENKDELGYVGFGYDYSAVVNQAAMNEAGLFYDFNALPLHKGTNEGAEPANILKYDEMIKTCRTVEEALKFLDKYDIDGIAKAQMVIGDATGASAIVERHTTTKRAEGKDFQVGTNFRTSTTHWSNITCWRFKLCTAGFQRDEPISIESVRSLMERSMPKGDASISWYTTICDLKAKKVYLFRKGDFAKVAEIDLVADLKEGKRDIDMDAFMQAESKPYSKAG
jgi:predicted choloylglycine hydrolase